MIRIAWWIALGLLAAGVTCCGKREKPAPHPLRALLASVPAPMTEADEEQLRCLEYLDVRAAERVAGVETPESVAAFGELTRSDQMTWIRAVDRASPVSVEFFSVFRSAKGMPAALGFGFFDVDRIVAFGKGPGPAQLFAGRFDAGAIGAVHQRRGYAKQAVDGLAATLWRRGDGRPEVALDPSAEPDPSNPLGGRYGWKQPLAFMGPDLVASALDWDATLAFARTHEDKRESVLSLPRYRSAVDLLVKSSKGDRTLVHAQLWRPSEFQAESLEAWLRMRFGKRASAETIAAESAKVGPIGRLPAYELACLADGQDGEDQVALIALVYASRADAEAGVDVLAERVTAFSPLHAKPPQPSIERVEGRIKTHVAKGVGDQRVAVVVVRYPVPENGKRARLFRTWIRSILGRSFTPLMRFVKD